MRLMSAWSLWDAAAATEHVTAQDVVQRRTVPADAEDEKMTSETGRMYLVLAALTVGALVGLVASSAYDARSPYEDRRDEVIGEMNSLIAVKTESGEYMCCIDPPCDMCFLGHWLWDDGVCRCDEYIANGDFDKACPQCKNGVGEGSCGSSQENTCEISLPV
jgi:hypothetical protein